MIGAGDWLEAQPASTDTAAIAAANLSAFSKVRLSTL